MRTPHQMAIDVDRCLSLSLSNGEFEALVTIIDDSEDKELTTRNIILCGARACRYVIYVTKNS